MNKSSLKCNYDHSNNPFNMEHKVEGTMALKKKKFNFKINLTSSLLNPLAYKKLDLKFCSNVKPNKNMLKEFHKKLS